MSSDRGAERRPARLGPESIARTTFPTSFRGYDPEHVRVFLEHIANELREARDREAALRTELESLEGRLAEAKELDESQLTAALGEETARVLTAAREAAAEIRAKASDSVARLLREAQEQATDLKREAETILASRTEEAEAEATRLTQAAREEAACIRADAAAEVEAEIEAAKAHGRELVEEALLVRTRVLEDLSRKRKSARAQLERLQAGRDRLMESYATVRRTLDEATDELRRSLSEAKLAADAAARRVEAEPAASVEELEREVQAARDAGLPLVGTDEPAPEDVSREADVVLEEAVAAEDEEAPFDGELPEEELVPLEPSAEFEEVRLVAATAPDATESSAEAVVVEIVEEVEVVEVVAPDEEDTGPVDVDELFARIRAAREAEVAKAHEVLAEQGAPEPAAEAEAEAEAEPAPEVEAEPEPQPEAVVGSASDAGPAVEAEPAVEPDVDADADLEPAPAPPAPDEQALLERRDAITDEVERKATRRLKRVLADEQNDVLDRLRRNRKARLDDLLPSPAEHAERYAAAVRAELTAVAAAGGSFYGGQAAKTDVDDLAVELGQALTIPLRDRIDSSLREAAGDDEALAEGARAVYRDWKTHRVESQARDTVIAAFNRGLFDALGPGARVRWLIDDGGSPCPDAEDNSLAGLVVRGEPFPTGHCYPPAHPGCRCLLVPEDH